MKKFNELGIRVIANLKNKVSDDELQKLLYKANDVLYAVQARFAVFEIAKDTLGKLKDIGVLTKNTQCSDKCNPKQEEILSRLRELCERLQCYLREYSVSDTEEKNAIGMIIKYQLSVSIKVKNTFLNDKNIQSLIKQIQENKTIYQLLSNKIWSYEINVNQFIKVQNELLDVFSLEYNLAKEE